MFITTKGSWGNKCASKPTKSIIPRIENCESASRSPSYNAAAARRVLTAHQVESLENESESMTISFSRYLAIVFGVLTPLAETTRRWSTWRENPPALFDDYILGALLLYGAWRVGKDIRTGQRFLAAGWAFMCGMAYSSFFTQLHDLRMGVEDPAPISSTWVAVIKGIGLALGILGLVMSLRRLPEDAN